MAIFLKPHFVIELLSSNLLAIENTINKSDN